MKLHRTDKVPEWKKVPRERQNKWQRRAEDTNGIDTPGNRATAKGGALVFHGLYEIHNKGRKLRGMLEIGAGRLYDIRDGQRADKTGTKSPMGEAFDAGVDGAEMVVALPVLVSDGMLPSRTAVIFGAQKVANTISTAVAKRRVTDIHPSATGKITAVSQWSSIGLYGLANIAHEAGYEQRAIILERGAQVAEAISATLGTVAAIGYARDALAPPSPLESSSLETDV